MLAGGVMMASFAGFYYYFPALFGIKYSRIFAYLHLVYYFGGQ
jgi:heme/copper-type cytochrome/quinol oxidase subunit 1